MPMKFIGRILFPRSAPWQQKKQLKIMLMVILTTLFFAAAVTAIMIFQNSKR